MSKIMLVEDDNNLREIYEARLIAEGYEIVSAKDGEEALAMAVKEKPDLIISDVMMPKISGFDMLDILRTTPETKNTKIIMMTALSQAEDKSRADKLGADRYLVKSQVTLEDVAAVAREVLSGEAGSPNPETPSTTPAPVATTPAPEPETPQASAAAPTATTPDEPAPVAATPPTPTDDTTTDESSTTATTQPSTTDPVSDTKSEEVQPTSETNPGAIDSSLFQDQEQTINSQINEFLATAQSSEPPEEEEPKAEPVAATPPPAPAPQDEVEHIAVTQAPPDATAAAADNAAKLADAVNDLLQKPGEAAPAVPEVSKEANSTAPETEEPTPAPAPEVKADVATETSTSDTMNNAATPEVSADKDSTVGAKKVIQPINDLTTSTPDLNALLEKEELKEAGVAAPQVQAQPPAENLVISADGEMQNAATAPAPDETVAPLPAPNTTIAPQVASETPAETTTPAPADPNDPNSIAL